MAEPRAHQDPPDLPTTRPPREPAPPPAPQSVGTLPPAPVQVPVVWEFGGEQYTQGELSIEGEALLIGLATRVLDALAATSPEGLKLGELVNADGDVNLGASAKLITTVSGQIPSVAGDALAILFGHYPTDLEGQPDPEFASVSRRLARAVPSAKVVDVLAAFVRQNDYQRLAGPFGDLAARFGIELPAMTRAPEQASAGSSDSPQEATATPGKSSGGSRSGKRSSTST